MKKYISAADANRQFSNVLRGVRDEHAHFVVTSHGKPVAEIAPFDADTKVAARARATLLKRLRSQPAMNIGPWTREELYTRGA
jgi:prevent-host-death family protein